MQREAERQLRRQAKRALRREVRLDLEVAQQERRDVRRQQVSAAARELLACYAQLARSHAHLLDATLRGRLPIEWEHYPAGDAIDRTTGCQYYYHCHAPARGPRRHQHGHFHLFARLDCRRHRIDARFEARFLESLGVAAQAAEPLAHLIGIALTPKGLPCELFTVNRWITGDRMLSAQAVQRALAGFALHEAGDPLVNRWLAALVRLFQPQIARLLECRDRRLRAAARRARRVSPLEDRRLEVLARLPIDLDARLRALEPGARAQIRLRFAA